MTNYINAHRSTLAVVAFIAALVIVFLHPHDVGAWVLLGLAASMVVLAR